MRRLTTTLALALVLGCAGSAPGQHTSTVAPATSTAARAPSDVGAKVNAIADEYLAARLAAFPELATHLGGPDARHDRLRDRSAAAERAWDAKEDKWLARLRALDGEVPIDDPAWVTYGLLREQLESGVARRVCRNRLWTVHPLTGWQSSYTALATQQPVGTPDLRAQALARWRQLPRLIDQEIANLREGVAAGYTAPKVNVRRVLSTIERLLAAPVTESPFYSPAARDSTPEFQAAFERLVADSIRPAVQRYRDYLADEYLDVARDDVAITAHPDGAACYRAAIRRYTTLDLSGEELHQKGVEALAAAESTAAALAKEAFGSDDVQDTWRRLQVEPSAKFGSREAMRAAIDTVLDRAWAAVPEWFTLLPKSELVVEPIPAFQEGASPSGQYLPPAADGSRPGVFRVNLGGATSPGKRLRIEGLTFHEAVPGHHFQLSLARERPGAHPVTRLLGASAFGEGWAVYAEHLADEMGLYSSPASRLSALNGRVYALSLLVAETGLHALGWSRAQAVEFMMVHTTASPGSAAAGIDRSAGWPGQGLAYTVGYLEILRLRELAKRKLGEQYDVREFHARVLEHGTITWPMVQTVIERWIE